VRKFILPGSDHFQPLTPEERRGVVGVASLFGLRMMGLYMVLPVLSTYAGGLRGSTSLLVGLSVGVYGLTQFLFQVPFGAMSDRWGRKPILTAGLLLFALGSVVCALAHTAWMLVLGRTIQGTGVVASTALAMLADLTRDHLRSRAMVTVGIALGGTFSFGLLFGPAAAARFGVPSLFWLTGVLATLAIPYLWFFVPAPLRVVHHEDVEFSHEHMAEVLRNPQLLRLDLGALNLHMSLTAIFVVMPFLLRQFLPLGHQWRVFLPLLTVGMLSMLLGARLAERPKGPQRAALLGQGLLILGVMLLALTVPASAREPGVGVTALVAGLLLFIAGFALLEPLFPALLTRSCQENNRGTAAGVFNMSQFMGAFLGGLLAGKFLDRDVEAMFWILAGTGAVWFWLALRLRNPVQKPSDA
jgi:MFS family permease